MRIQFLVFLQLGPGFVRDVVVRERNTFVGHQHAKGFSPPMTLKVFDIGNSIWPHIAEKVFLCQLTKRVVPDSGPFDGAPLELSAVVKSFENSRLQQSAILLVQLSSLVGRVQVVVELHSHDHDFGDAGS